MSIIRFVDRGVSDSSRSQYKPSPSVGILKYSLKKNLPEGTTRNVLIYTTDTQELFYGRGVGSPLGKISDVLLFEERGDFPETGLEDKLYINKKLKEIYYWENDRYELIQGGLGDGISEAIIDELYDLIDSMVYSGYIQEDNLSQEAENEFHLQYKPVPNTIKMVINGIEYSEGAFEYDKSENKIIWRWTKEEGGFDLLPGWHVKIVYDFNYTENGISNIKNFHDSLNKKGETTLSF